MSIASKLAAKLANEDYQELFVNRLLEPVELGGKYGDLLKLYEIVARLPAPDGDGRPLAEISDSELRGLLKEISGRDLPDALMVHPGGDGVPEAGRGAVFKV